MDVANRVKEKIVQCDKFAQLVGAELIEVRPGYAKVKMTIEDRHLNSAGITHGAAVFSAVDLAFEAASNSHGQVALALNINISFLKATVSGNTLTAEAVEENRTNRTGLYRITVVDETGDLAAVCEALVYRKKDQLVSI